MAKQIGQSDVEKMPPGLADEVITAAIHYRLWSQLRESIAEYEKEFNESGTFWFLTLNAHLIAARAALFRSYDRSPEGVNLAQLIEQAGPRCNFSQSEIDIDKKSVSKGEVLVDKLLWQRNNLFAHKNLKNILTGRIAESANARHDSGI